MLVALILILLVIAFPIVLGYFISAPKYSGPVNDHFDGKKFINPDGVKPQGFSAVFKWLFTRERIKRTYVNAPYGEKPADHIGSGLRITFVNHSTFLIQIDGLNILTDPIWSDRASPFSWAGPKRLRPPGIRLEDLPKMDIILLSHNHYDHLNVSTLRWLYEKFHPRIFTSLGVKVFLEKKKIFGAVEMDWWNDVPINDNLKIACVPAQHFSGRGMFDRDATLWSGFVIRRKGESIYFVADTGYSESMFREIGKKFAPIKVAIIPIGAYKPRWFMSPIHTSPEESVKIHLDLRSQKSIASHFGTFPLGDDIREGALEDLNMAKQKFNLSPDAFLVMEEGKGIDL